MGIDSSFEPILQIIHISDMHVVSPGAPDVISDIEWLRNTLTTSMWRWVQKETAGHDRFAPPKFCNFLPEITSKDPVWSKRPTWLLDTGDLTAYGDEASLDEGQDWLKQFCSAAGNPQTKFLYGNHDAWPGRFPYPLPPRPSEIERHRDGLRSRWYPYTFPDSPLTCPIPGSPGLEIQLWSLNSVIHETGSNWRAVGAIQEDRYWEGDASGSRAPGNAVRVLASRIASKNNGKRHFRILACHHPIHYPEPRLPKTMVMQNAKGVANDLARLGKPNNNVPLAHLILSGHTHVLFPPLGKLPSQVADCGHAPLKHSQCQLVAPSLCQRQPEGTPWRQQCQVLRLYASDKQPDICVERLIAARANALGQYAFVELAKDVYSESILIGF